MAAEATELESLNRILAGALSHPATATSDNRPDVQSALRILQETDRDIQTQGHFFNTYYGETFTSVADRITIDADIISVHESSGYDEPGVEYPITDSSVSIRYDGATRSLYNNITNSFVFAGDVTLNVVRRIDYEKLPQYVREYITNRAAAEFYELARGMRSARLEEREQSSRASFHQQEMEIGQFNTFRNPHDAWVRYNR